MWVWISTACCLSEGILPNGFILVWTCHAYLFWGRDLCCLSQSLHSLLMQEGQSNCGRTQGEGYLGFCVCEDICRSNSENAHTVFNSRLSSPVVMQPLGLSWTNSLLDPTWCRAVIVPLKHELLHIHPLRLHTLERRQSSRNNSPWITVTVDAQTIPL